MSALLTEKQAQFNAAMERYERTPAFRLVTRVVAFSNVALQLATAYLLVREPIGYGANAIAIVTAYVLADFINGWVHLHMDNSDNYESFTGPFYAAFHLHHRTPRYRLRPVWLVYYEESGSKVWLCIVEVLLFVGVGLKWHSPWFAHLVLYFAILSCVAEVSHYLCHVPPTRWGRVLARVGLLLSSRYHGRHHREDNVQYAFLNGMTDPLLDWIAKRFYSGYKSTTDRHFAQYFGKGTENRH
ncbi:MAG TPA: fatty acid desaturase CarF family protein [Polyangiaceae bacterium]